MELNTDFSNFPVLETTNLLLREVVERDVEEVFLLRSDKDIMKYIPRPLAQTKEDAFERIRIFKENKENEEGINWAITQKGNDKMLGVIGVFRIEKENLRAEVGYMILPDYQGKGIIGEALEKVMDFAFKQVKLHSLTAIIDPRNTASERVLQRANFIKEAHFKEDCYHNGEFLDSVHYSILSTNFLSN